MENKTLSRYDIMERSEYRTVDSSGPLTDSQTSGLYQQLLSTEDILIEDFTEEETFVLREEFVRMEDEYVMWQGTTPCKKKNAVENFGAISEEEALSLPEDDSLQHMSEYFNLKTSNWPKRHY